MSRDTGTWLFEISCRDILREAFREFHVTDTWLWDTHTHTHTHLRALYSFYSLFACARCTAVESEIYENIDYIITGSAVPLANFSLSRDDSLDSVSSIVRNISLEWLDISHEMQTIAARLAWGCSLPRLRRCVNLQFPVKWSANIRPSTCAYTMPALLSYEQHARDSVVTNPACPHIPQSI